MNDGALPPGARTGHSFNLVTFHNFLCLLSVVLRHSVFNNKVTHQRPQSVLKQVAIHTYKVLVCNQPLRLTQVCHPQQDGKLSTDWKVTIGLALWSTLSTLLPKDLTVIIQARINLTDFSSDVQHCVVSAKAQPPVK